MANLTSSLVVRLIDGISAPAKQAAAALRQIGAAARGLSGGGLSGVQQRLGAAISSNNRAIEALNDKLLVAAGSAWALGRAIKSVVSPAIELESAVADLAKVSDFSEAGLADFVREARKAAPALGITTKEFMKFAEAGAAAGVAEGELFSFTKLTAEAATAWSQSSAQAGDNLAKIKTALGLNVEQTRLLADAINTLSDKTAASASDLTDYSRRVGSVGKQYGFTANQTLAFGASMISSGAEADVAATSFRNVGKALTRGASATKAQRGAYKALGLDAVMVSKAMQKNAVGTTLDVIERIGKLPKHMQASTISDLFGDEARAVAPLLDQTEKLRENLGYVSDETRYAGSVQREFATRSKTTQSAIDRLRSSVDALAGQVGAAFLPVIRDAADTIGPLAKRLGDWAEANPKAVLGIAGIVGGLIGLKVAALGASIGGRLAYGGLLLLAKGALLVVKPFAKAAAAARGAVQLQRALAGMAGLKMGVFSTVATALRGVVSTLPLIGGVLAGVSAPVAAGIAAVVAVVAGGAVLLYKYFDRVVAVVRGVGRRLGAAFGPVLGPVKAAFQPVLDFLGTAASWLGDKLNGIGSVIASFLTPERLGAGDKAAWERWGFDLADGAVQGFKNALNGLVDWCAGLWGRVKAVFTSIDLGSLIRWPTMPWSSGGGSTSPTPAQPAAPTMPGRAGGGSVGRGRAFMVGERRRPEIFVPQQDGRITRPEDLVPSGGAPAPAGAAVTVNQTLHITAGGISNPVELARLVRRGLRDEFAAAMRGAHADLNLA